MIVNARFLSSASNISNAIEPKLPEIAFLGRSNVGKSSLINALCKHKNLAKSSSTPGKTRLINFFEITYKEKEEKIKIIFIDLPGFGYAKVSKSLKEEWNKNLDDFLKKRKSIRLLIQLRDSRHIDLQIDEEIKAYLQGLISPNTQFFELFTKADKLNQSELSKLRAKNLFHLSIKDKKSLEALSFLILKKALFLA